MTKTEFMRQISKELSILPEEERISALKYYEEYFDEAGAENEQSVISELESPKAVAESILEEFYQNNPNIARPKVQPENSFEPLVAEEKQRFPLWAILLICVCASPIIFPMAGAVFVAAVAAVCVLFAIFIVSIVLFFVGIVVCVSGIIAMFTNFATGFLILGSGMVLIGISIIFTALIVNLYIVLIPKIIRGIVNVCKLPFRNSMENGGALA